MNVFRRNPRAASIEALYGAIVAQARTPAFYRSYGVPDTVNGRLDLLMLHLALVFERLAQGPNDMRTLGQEVFDRFCRDMDEHLREDGVSDLKVPKEMRKLAAAFFGRHGSYLSALKAGDRAGLEAALARNVYRAETSPAGGRLAAYAEEASRALSRQDFSALGTGKLSWPDPGRISAPAMNPVTNSVMGRAE